MRYTANQWFQQGSGTVAVKGGVCYLSYLSESGVEFSIHRYDSERLKLKADDTVTGMLFLYREPVRGSEGCI